MEPLLLLELHDGIASGPRHTPALKRTANGTTEHLDTRIHNNNGIPPKTWIALCGAKGILYRSDAAVFSQLKDCFGCRCQEAKRAVPSWRRYETDEDRIAARRRAWRESQRRRRAA